MRPIAPLLTAFLLLAPATAGAAHAGAPVRGSHSAYVVTVTVPAGESAPAAGFGGPATTYDAVVLAHRPGCARAKPVLARENGEDIVDGETLHFSLPAPAGGWCGGHYRVVMSKHVAVAAAPDACTQSPDPAQCMRALAPQTTTTVLGRSAFAVV